jgi:hypothetical protein
MADQTLIVPRARTETCYVMVRSQRINGPSSQLQLSFQEFEDLRIGDVTPSFSARPEPGSTREVNVLVRGAGFRPDTTFRLEESGGNGHQIPGRSTVISPTQAEATFELSSDTPVASYDMVVVGSSAREEDAFEIIAEGRRFAMQIQPFTQSFTRAKDRTFLIIDFENASDRELFAPIFKIEAIEGEVEFRLLLEREQEFSPTLYALGTPIEGPADRLPPGGRGRLFVLYQSPTICDGCAVRIGVSILGPGPEDFIPWHQLENPEPEVLTETEWKRIRAPLSVNLGRTWDDWQQAIGDRARRNSWRGVNPQAIDAAFLFAVAEASGQPVAAAVGSLYLEGGGPPLPTTVAVREGESPVTQTETAADGRFVVKRLAAGGTYLLEVAGHDIVADRSGQASITAGMARISLPPEAFSVNGAGDLLGLELVVVPSARRVPAGVKSPEKKGPSLPTPPDELFKPAGELDVTIIASQDPNDKRVERGRGDSFDLHFTVNFENSSTVSAAARHVEVVDTLDTTVYDVENSLVLGSVILGGEQEPISLEPVSPGALTWSSVSTTIEVEAIRREVEPPDSRPTTCEAVPEPEYVPIDVQIDATLEQVSDHEYELRWLISSSCPPDLSPCLAEYGFLPPNTHQDLPEECDTHRGEASVSFTIRPVNTYGSALNSVRVSFDKGTSTETHTITIDLDATDRPEAAEVLSPEDDPEGTSLVDLGTILRWESVSHADGYELSVWEDLSGETVVTETLPAGSTAYEHPGGWQYSTKYCWKVVPQNSFGSTLSVPTWTFHTRQPVFASPGTVSLQSPPYGSVVLLDDLSLSWLEADEASTYTLYIWEYPGDGEPEPTDLRAYAHVGTITDYSTLGLEEGQTYAWKVVASNEAGETESETGVFTVVGSTFRRGDVNDDGRIDISDPVMLLLHLFLDSFDPPCRQAADVDDSGAIQITDVVVALSYLFAGGQCPPAPGIECGIDPTPDSLGCSTSEACSP